VITRIFFCYLLGLTSFTFGEQPVTFNGDIRPILSDKCFACHGPSEPDREGDLRLDRPDGEFGALTVREDSFSQFIIKPGDPEESELWYRITTDDGEDRMPPEESHKNPLTDGERELVRKWILDGGDYQSFWSFVPPAKTSPTPIKNVSWGASMIDNRVMAKLEEDGLEPNEEANRRTLIRRATFDLTGLPPTLEEIDAFLNDERPDAYRHLVDVLLQQPSYGEHMTRYWADLVRLADTNGMHKDFNRDFTTYRDWLIRSFNANLPFDEFVKHQLAGDLYEKPTHDQLVASGFNRLHMIIDRGTALPEESLHKNVVDRVEAFGTAFLGMTVQCAQCHDHKYDPLSQNEYYQLYGFFNNFSGQPETVNTPKRGLQPPFIHLTSPEQQKDLDKFQTEKARLTDLRSATQREIESSLKWPNRNERVPVPWIWKNSASKSETVEFKTLLKLKRAPQKALVRFTGMSTAEVSINEKSLGKARALDKGVSLDVSNLLTRGKNVITAKSKGEPGFALVIDYEVDGELKQFTTDANWQAKLEKEDAWKTADEIHTPQRKNFWTQKTIPAEITQIDEDIKREERRTNRFLDSIPAAMVMEEKNPFRPTMFLHRGAYDDPGDPVERNTPAFLPPMKKKEGTYTRMDLAEWLVDPDHPLTARVAVNRFWQQFFGVGLVKTSEDFGAQGEWPSHPALLDALAVSFVESGWDVKDLVRSILLSNTYKQRSEAAPEEYVRDPENRLLARGSSYRMDAEMIRDQILAVSGQLNTTMFGRSVKPPQPPGLWEMVGMAEPLTYVADTDENVYRRSLYTYWRRGMPPPQMTIMNAPSREYCVARRERTNTPLQALLLMNEQEYFDAAKACVKSTLPDGVNVDEGLRLIYEKITSQEPDPERLEFMSQTLQEFKEIYGNDKTITEALTPELNESDFQERVDVAAWTMLTHGLLNLELTKVRR
jgi:hypothetical protein